MTLQENIDAMTEIANLADKDFGQAKDDLLDIITSNRSELMQLGQRMRKVPKYQQPTLSTFDSEYVALFMDAFRKVDALLTKVMTSGALDEEEFLCPEFEKIGIEYFPQGPVKKRIFTRIGENDLRSGEPFDFNYIQNLIRPGTSAVFYRWWAYPDKFYYDYSDGGVDYGELYLYDPDKSIGVEERFWNDDIKCWGPYKHSHIATGDLHYVDLISGIVLLYGESDTSRDSQGIYATYRGNPAELNGKIFKKSNTGFLPPSMWSDYTKRIVDTAALMCKTSDGKDYYCTIDPTGSMLQYYAIQPDGCEDVFNFGQAMGHVITIGSPIPREIIIRPSTSVLGDFSFVSVWHDDPVTPEKGVWQPLAGVDEIYVSYSNFGQMLYKFNKFLMGYFGSKATTKGQDVLLQQFMRKAKDNDEAEQWADWFNDEAKEFSDTTAMSAALSTPRAVEHAASLYSVKFAIMKIMYGHARRLQFG